MTPLGSIFYAVGRASVAIWESAFVCDWTAIILYLNSSPAEGSVSLLKPSITSEEKKSGQREEYRRNSLMRNELTGTVDSQVAVPSVD